MADCERGLLALLTGQPADAPPASRWLFACACVLLLVAAVTIVGIVETRRRLTPVLAKVRRRLLRASLKARERGPRFGYDDPRTGDVLLLQFRKHGLVGLDMLELVPSHSAFVWVHPTRGPLAIECTVFGAPPLPNILTTTHPDGVRFVPLHYFLKRLDAWCVVRRYRGPPILNSAMEMALSDAPQVRFEAIWARSPRWDAHFVLTLGSLFPGLCDVLSWTSGLSQPRTSAFCSEYLLKTLRRVGAAAGSRPAHAYPPVGLLGRNPESDDALPLHASPRVLHCEPFVGRFTSTRSTGVYGIRSVFLKGCGGKLQR